MPHVLFQLVTSALLLGLPTDAKLYGQSMVHNSPVQAKLVRIDSTEGNLTELGDPMGPDHGAMGATSDLRAVDTKRGVFYFLGDSHAGTTLVGQALADGALVCAGTVPLAEVGFVGLGQSMTFDWKNDELVLTGLVANSTGGFFHQILRGSLSAGLVGGGAPCAKFKKAGQFWFSSSAPMIHTSALDVENQRLYSLISASKSQIALAVIDLTAQALKSIDLEDGSGRTTNILDGMAWEPKTKRLVGVMPGAQTQHPPTAKLNLVSLDPATGKFDPIRDLVMDDAGGAPGTVWILDGNEGEVHSYDPDSGMYFVLLSSRTSGWQPGDPTMKTVATIDWDTGALLLNPEIQYNSSNHYHMISTLAWVTEDSDRTVAAVRAL